MLIEERKTPDQQTKHGRMDEPDYTLDEPLKIAAQPAALAKPRKRALDHPSPGQHTYASAIFYCPRKPLKIALLKRTGELVCAGSQLSRQEQFRHFFRTTNRCPEEAC